MRARAALALLLGSCTTIADFPTDRLIEQTEALCANGVDDDEDGLADCQDWKCLGQATCCTIPTVVLEDAFESEACAAQPCAGDDRACAPDPERWERWGAPYPYLCEGALAIGKDFASCYPVGMLSRASVRLEPGLRLEARVSGIPESAGRLDLGFTRQATVIDGADPCAAVARVAMLVNVIYAAADGGVRFIAALEGVPIAQTFAAGAGPHGVSLRVTDERTFEFAVDGVPFATTGEPLPADLDLDARVVASGLGTASRLEHLRVVTGTQCDVPDAWTEAAPFTPLEPPAGVAWDAFERRTPNAALDAAGRVLLRYVGCTATTSPLCEPFSISIGEAVASAGSAFQRPDEPLFPTNLLAPPFPLDFAVVEPDRVAYFGLDGDGADRIGTCVIDGDDATIQASVAEVLTASPAGAWDSGAICCPSVIVRGADRWMYYAGHAEGDATWRIGLAVSHAGGPFERLPDPVLEPGRPGEFDERGITQPAVIYDEARQLHRMWYVATGIFGSTSIGYAVSTDGLVWHGYPDNPVLTPEDHGLVSIGSPTVVDDGGRLRLWIDGFAPGALGRTIYELENRGSPPP